MQASEIKSARLLDLLCAALLLSFAVTIAYPCCWRSNAKWPNSLPRLSITFARIIYGQPMSAILGSTFVFKFTTALIFPILAATISA